MTTFPSQTRVGS